MQCFQVVACSAGPSPCVRGCPKLGMGAWEGLVGNEGTVRRCIALSFPLILWGFNEEGVAAMGRYVHSPGSKKKKRLACQLLKPHPLFAVQFCTHRDQHRDDLRGSKK